MDLIKILMAGMEAEAEKSRTPIAEKEQVKRLENFVSRKIDFKVGERVTRNEDGENRYKMPRNTEVAYVASVFEKPLLDESGSVVHGEIAIPLRRPGTEDIVVISYAVDFRYYKRRPQLA